MTTDEPAPTAVALFVTCVADVVEPDVAVAAVRVLRAAGCKVSVPAGQTCCGQPAWNSGFVDEAAAVARASLDALAADEADCIVVPAGSCATMIRLYWAELFRLADDPASAERAEVLAGRVRELTEFLEDRTLPAASMAPTAVVYHQSCHLLRELHVVDAPHAAIDRIDGCERAEWSTADQCCGFGGTFSVKLPETSVAMADDKLDTLPADVGLIVGADASCLMQLRTRAEHRGLPVTTVHVAELLADALERAGGAPADP